MALVKDVDGEVLQPSGDYLEADLELVRQNLTSEQRLLAVYRTDPQTVKTIATAARRQLTLIPCLWPCLLCCGWALPSRERYLTNTLQNTVYFCTDSGLGQVVRNFEPCPSHMQGSAEAKEIGGLIEYVFHPWSDVQGIQAFNPPGGLLGQRVSGVRVVLPGITSTGWGDNLSVNQNAMVWLVSNTQECMNTLMQLRRETASRGGLDAGVVTALTVDDEAAKPKAGSAKIRVFVKRSGVAPGEKADDSDIEEAVMMLVAPESTTMSELCTQVDDALGLPSGRTPAHALALRKDGARVRITSPAFLESNDVIFVDP